MLVGLEAAGSSSSRGEVQLLSLANGEVAWARELDAAPTAVLLAGEAGDDPSRALVGTAASNLLSVQIDDGDIGWRRPLQNLNRTRAPVTALAVADLAGDGG